MTSKVSADLIKMRSEQARTRLFRADGVVSTVAQRLRAAANGDVVTAKECGEMWQALTLAAEAIDDAAGQLEGDVIVLAPTAKEREELGEEEQRRVLYEAELDRLPSEKPN